MTNRGIKLSPLTSFVILLLVVFYSGCADLQLEHAADSNQPGISDSLSTELSLQANLLTPEQHWQTALSLLATSEREAFDYFYTKLVFHNQRVAMHAYFARLLYEAGYPILCF